jgi:hypothetical protein
MYQFKEGFRSKIGRFAGSMAGMNCMKATLIEYGMQTKGIGILRSVCCHNLLGKKPMQIELIKLKLISFLIIIQNRALL